MKKLQGMKWGQLTEKEQNQLYIIANVDSDNIDKEGFCIVDIDEDLAVVGRVVNEGDERELIIGDDAILYNPIG